MDLFLVRQEFKMDGVFSELRGALDEMYFKTLEHSYEDEDGYYAAKINDGRYSCVRGFHRLKEEQEPFETFEIMGVPDHTGLLFHVGNFTFDSKGCVLLGIGITNIGGMQAITRSKEAFRKFMDLQKNCSQFYLTVKSP